MFELSLALLASKSSEEAMSEQTAALAETVAGQIFHKQTRQTGHMATQEGIQERGSQDID